MPVNTYNPSADQAEAIVFNPGSLAEAQTFAGAALQEQVVSIRGTVEEKEWRVNTLERGWVPIRNGNLLVKAAAGDFFPMHAGDFHKRWKQV